ncbi:MAG: HNH endonuclease, partial [Oligoflexales bacterium]|nr:HNH endonuclease [Oligoflexales bacterium]
KLASGMDPNRGHPQAVAIYHYQLAQSKIECADETENAMEKSIDPPFDPGNIKDEAEIKSSEAKGMESEIKPENPSEKMNDKSCVSKYIKYAREHIPSETRHRVTLRDEGRCTWVSPEGKRCEARNYLQIDHIKMVCDGGSNDIENLRLLCSTHNRLESYANLENRHLNDTFFRNNFILFSRENAYSSLP